MKNYCFALMMLISASAFAQGTGSHYVRGHVTKKGTYVSGHYAKNPTRKSSGTGTTTTRSHKKK